MKENERDERRIAREASERKKKRQEKDETRRNSLESKIPDAGRDSLLSEAGSVSDTISLSLPSFGTGDSFRRTCLILLQYFVRSEIAPFSSVEMNECKAIGRKARREHKEKDRQRLEHE